MGWWRYDELVGVWVCGYVGWWRYDGYVGMWVCGLVGMWVGEYVGW